MKLRLNYLQGYMGKTCHFTIPVESVEEANKILDTLAFVDLFKEQLGMTPDYINSITLETLDSDGDWVEAVDEDEEPLQQLSPLWETHFQKILDAGEDVNLKDE